MKVLVVGGGGREHTICWKLAKSEKVDKIYCAPGNGGISEIAECFDVKATDIEGMIELAKKLNPDMVVVAPDDPLVLGMVDEMTKAGFRAFGPRACAAIIEGSKSFSKELMKKYNIPTAKYEVFTDSKSAIDYINEQGAPIVVKADGLALGKGVVVAKTTEEAIEAVKEIMEDKKFGASGSKVVIEECLSGPEVSVLAFTDGKTIYPMVSAQDHKRAYDNDEGPNTGGMGTFSPSRIYTEELAKECFETIFMPTVNAMVSEGRTFKGVLYFGLMITENGPKVIEYNCRLGDPEAQVCLSLLETDLLEIMNAVIDGTLEEVEFSNKEGGAIVVMMCSGGYPEAYAKGKEITGLKADGQNDKFHYIFHSGTALKDGKYLSNGGRVLGFVCLGKDVKDAQDKVYAAIDDVSFENSFYRHDIGGKR